MSQLATVYRVSQSAVENPRAGHGSMPLREAVLSEAKEMTKFDYDGFSLVMAAQYLSEICKINILDSPYTRIASELAKDGGSFFFLDVEQCNQIERALQALTANSMELDAYYEEFNGTSSHGHGVAMLAGFELFKSLSIRIQEGELFLIGIE